MEMGLTDTGEGIRILKIQKFHLILQFHHLQIW